MILVVDDDPQIRRALEVNLRARRYEVRSAPDGRQALLLAGRAHPDLIVLDLGLPDMDGSDVIEGIRGWSATPIIVLSGRVDSTDKIRALDAGADDYVTKPFEIEELFARVRAVSRRPRAGDEAAVVQIGEHTVDLAGRAVTTGGGGSVRLTPTEWHVLEMLLRSPGRLITQRQILQEVWGPQYREETSYLRVYMTQLRRKLEPVPARPRYLITEPGMGYRFQP